VYQIINFFLANFSRGPRPKSHDFFLLLNINILILHYASMQSEIDKTNLLRRSIARFEVENNKIKARIAKLEDMQTQNELLKNLLSTSYDKNR
jgi:hypothetical protein